MGHIKKYSRFVEEFVMGDTETKPITTPAPTTVPRPRPRPGIAPIETPSEEDAPLASGTETKPITTPAPTTVPRPRPRPGIAPIETPSEEDAPLAVAKKVMDRLERVYSESSKKEQDEIDSHFEK